MSKRANLKRHYIIVMKKENIFLKMLTASAATICWMPVVQLFAKFKCVRRSASILAISHKVPLDIAPLGLAV